MKKKQQTMQLLLEYPPPICQGDILVWQKLKNSYGNHIVFIIVDGFYIALGEDANYVHEIAEQPIFIGDIEICFFSIPLLSQVMQKLSDRDLRVAICDPPNDPEKHLFT